MTFDRKLCINSLAPSVGTLIFQSLLIPSISDMVHTCSTHPLHHPVQPPLNIPGGSNNSGLAEFLKQMAESMEVLRKQNEELNAQFTAAETQREKESAERREKERRDRVHRGKQITNPHLEDNESTVQERSQRRREEEAPSKSRREEEPNSEARRERSHREKSVHEGYRRENHDEARSHRSRRHRNGSHHGESWHNRQEAKMKEL